VTLQLVVMSVLLGALISIPVAAGRLSHSPIIGGIAFGYSYFFRARRFWPRRFSSTTAPASSRPR
jgi:amino acid ABC transporter membrane protein 2, PAAT family (TC 3.A.1.3.-)